MMPVHLESQEVPAPAFSDAVQIWLARESVQLKASSLVKYRNIINKHLLPRYADVPIGSLRRDALAELSRELLREGLGTRSVNAILSVMRSILCHAQRSGLPAEDPGVLSIRQSVKPLRVFSRSEQERLTAYLLACGSLPARGMLLSLYAGLRIGEVCALTWGDISFEDRCIHVRHTMQRLQTMRDGPKTAVQITVPKSACSLRTIPLPDWLMELLQGLRKADDCFFLTGCRDKYIEPRSMENRFKRALAACGISGATYHTCRHSFATRCVELGFDVKSLSEILGHASVNITMNRYVHPSMEYKRDNMSRLTALLPQGEGK